ncbi:hypothetical protein Tco_0792345 [Tanacetum coccineum]
MTNVTSVSKSELYVVVLTGHRQLREMGLVDSCDAVAGDMWLHSDAVTLLKRIRNFSVAQDIGVRAAIHIFNRISFAIARGVGTQIVSRLPTSLL